MQYALLYKNPQVPQNYFQQLSLFLTTDVTPLEGVYSMRHQGGVIQSEGVIQSFIYTPLGGCR